MWLNWNWRELAKIITTMGKVGRAKPNITSRERKRIRRRRRREEDIRGKRGTGALCVKRYQVTQSPRSLSQMISSKPEMSPNLVN